MKERIDTWSKRSKILSLLAIILFVGILSVIGFGILNGTPYYCGIVAAEDSYTCDHYGCCDTEDIEESYVESHKVEYDAYSEVAVVNEAYNDENGTSAGQSITNTTNDATTPGANNNVGNSVNNNITTNTYNNNAVNTPGNTGNNSSNTNTAGNTTNNNNVTAPHHHTWVGVYTNTTREVDNGRWETITISEAWTETRPVFETRHQMRCNCGVILNPATMWEHSSRHLQAGENDGWRDEWVQVQTGTTTIHHSAVTDRVWVSNIQTVTERTRTGERCSGCGATR